MEQGLTLLICEVIHKRSIGYKLTFGTKVILNKWNLIVVYSPAHDKEKLNFPVELSSFCEKNKEPLIIGVTLTSSDSRMKKKLFGHANLPSIAKF